MQKTHPFTFLEIMFVVMVIGLLAVLAIPGFMRARTAAHKNTCGSNMRIVRDSLTQYKFEHGFSGEVPGLTLEDLRPYMKEVPKCPSGGEYRDIGAVPYCTVHDDRAVIKLNPEDL